MSATHPNWKWFDQGHDEWARCQMDFAANRIYATWIEDLDTVGVFNPRDIGSLFVNAISLGP